ncbi:hypothetical protein MtrunA17_Chr2g0320391 [Medicago truncatula]|uniref:Uncharacterized protein n=1 Tax=Medicago truncatula TaxID=3880 RepID=A0A396JAQ1_MEDTR|nr:hypothetical protein MtrunA17_Chr2g0320391 [Medicago truncatula]
MVSDQKRREKKGLKLLLQKLLPRKEKDALLVPVGEDSLNVLLVQLLQHKHSVLQCMEQLTGNLMTDI